MQNPKNEAPTNQSTGTPTAQAEGNNTQNQTAQQSADEKRFTQADVDKIVGERLNREREKLEAERKRETMKQNARAAWLKAGYDPETFDGLELDEEGRIGIDKAVDLFGKLHTTTTTEKKTANPETDKLPRFTTSPVNLTASETPDRLREAFKAPHH